MAPKAARRKQIESANARLEKRRGALRVLNDVVATLGFPSLRVDVKAAPTNQSLNKLFRFLGRRELDAPVALGCRHAIVSFTDNGGKLPDNVALSPEGALVTAEDTSATVPGHKVLVSSFRLHSRAFMVTYNSVSFTLDTWRDFKAWAQAFARKYGARAWAACFEESLHAAPSSGALASGKRYHGHAYFIWMDDVGIFLRSLDPLSFNDVRPRVDICKGPASAANAWAPRRAALHGLWYVTVIKDGTVHSDTNFKPWLHYSPSAQWLTSLYDAKKMTHELFLKMSADFRTGHAKRKRDADAVVRHELEAAIVSHVESEMEALRLRGATRPFKDYPLVAAFVESFRVAEERRPILLLVGGTNTGKSLFAADVLRRVAEVVGTPSFLEVTVENDDNLDLSRFDHRKHAGVIFDGVGDALALWHHRETMQGRPKACCGGRSATMVYAYPFTFARRAVVVTMDLSARNLHLLDTDHWLNDSRNLCCWKLTAPAYDKPGAVAAPPPPRSETVAAWSVRDVAAFHRGRDAEGAAKVMEENSVGGTDLLAFTTWPELQAELRVTPFLARKALTLRDAFLAS